VVVEASRDVRETEETPAYSRQGCQHRGFNAKPASKEVAKLI